MGSFERCRSLPEVRLVTLVGEPGLGKTRLTAELRATLDRSGLPVTWLRGRCLPYGEGITFWALGEIVKGRAGILESDPPDAARAKLDAVLPLGDERAWFRERLLPLLGVESASAAEPGELYAAWRRFLRGSRRSDRRSWSSRTSTGRTMAWSRSLNTWPTRPQPSRC